LDHGRGTVRISVGNCSGPATVGRVIVKLFERS